MKNLGNRIKRYEKINKSYLLPNSYSCLRIDGKAHHTYCRGLDRPFDDRYIAAMTEASRRLCKEVQGFELGYQQSDEFSLVFSDKRSQDACLWFGGNIQKINSVAASIFTLTFNQYLTSSPP